MMQYLGSVYSVTKVILCVVIILVMTPEVQTQSASQSTNPLSVPFGARQLFGDREQLDQDLWAPEVLAQRYERRFVALWDALLTRDDKFAILAAVPFSKLTMGTPGRFETLGLGIQRSQFGAPTVDLDPAAWKRLLDRFQREGYVIEQTEWHHSKFEMPQNERPASSEVVSVIHATRADPAHRVMLRAVLRVEWSPRVDAEDLPIPDRIVIKDVEMLERHAPAAFQEVFTVERTQTRYPLGPLLVQDLDGDGLSEIILGGFNQTLWNRGNGQFAAEPFLADDQHIFSDAGILADFTNDGYVDFVAVNTSMHPFLFEGSAEGQFVKKGTQISEATFEQPRSLTAGDIDADGDLDLFIANYKSAYIGGQMPSPYYDANDGFPAALLRNDGDGSFTDVTDAAGLGRKRFRRTYSSSFVDLDEDRDMDLLVVSDFAGFDMYLNDGHGHFTDVTEVFGRDRHMFGMSHTFGDYDLDGDLDFYVTGMSSTTARRLESLGLGRNDKPEHNALRQAMGYGNRMFLRNGNGFEPASFNADVARTGWSWGTSSFDFDNDGDKDIFVANGHISGGSTQDYCTTFWRHDIYTDDSQDDVARENMFQFVMTPLQETEISWNGYEHKVLLMNHGGTGFTNVAYLLGAGFEYDGRAVVTEDLDADGRVDLLVLEFKSGGGAGDQNDQILHVYQNRLMEAGNWVGVRLDQARSNRSPIGATVTVVTATGSQMTRFVTGDSFSAQHSATAHFGLGDLTAIDSIEIEWADGTHQRIENPAVNQYLALPLSDD
jgi:hypothetical protein